MTSFRDNSIYKSGLVTSFNTNGASPVFLKAGAGKLLRTRTGESFKGWKQRIKLGLSATTTLNGVYDTYEGGTGSGSIWFYDHFNPQDKTLHHLTVSGDIAQICRLPSDGSNFGAISSSSTAYNKALIAFLKEASNIRTSFQSGIFFGEFHQVINMIKHPAAGAFNILNSYLSNISKAKGKGPSFKKNLSSLWLEARFGLLPLISDISAAKKAWNNLANNQIFRPCQGFGSFEKQIAAGDTLQHSTNGKNWLSNLKSTEKTTCRIKGIVAVSSNLAIYSAEQFGLTVEQFVPTIWELLPWSFLIDYFVNIGDVLDAQAGLSADVRWMNTTIRTTQTIQVGILSDSSADKALKPLLQASSGFVSPAKHERVTVSRYADTPHMPSLMFKIPTSPIQYANMLALLVQKGERIFPQSGVFKFKL